MINVYKLEGEGLKNAKKVLENPDVALNMWARNGYTMRDAKTLGLDKNCTYLYVNGLDEFFSGHEKEITSLAGIEKIKSGSDEYTKVKEKIEEEQNGAASGVGAIFG
ncbi:MAG: hypothetical protein V1911_04240 [Candidatus Micrarchaeota archaeon]